MFGIIIFFLKMQACGCANSHQLSCKHLANAHPLNISVIFITYIYRQGQFLFIPLGKALVLCPCCLNHQIVFCIFFPNTCLFKGFLEANLGIVYRVSSRDCKCMLTFSLFRGTQLPVGILAGLRASL